MGNADSLVEGVSSSAGSLKAGSSAGPLGYGPGLEEGIRPSAMCTLVLIFCVCEVEMVTAPKIPCESDSWSWGERRQSPTKGLALVTAGEVSTASYGET